MLYCTVAIFMAFSFFISFILQVSQFSVSYLQKHLLLIKYYKSKHLLKPYLNKKLTVCNLGCFEYGTMMECFRMQSAQMVLQALTTISSLIITFVTCCSSNQEKKKVCKYVFNVFETDLVT